MATICETTVRVRYAETDQMSVVYHTNYLVWFEVGRVELLRQLGFGPREIEDDGLNFPVVEVKCRYKHPALYDDEIIIRTQIIQLRSSLLRFHYELIRKADGRLLAEGESVHFVVERGLKRTQLSQKYWRAFCAATANNLSDAKD